MGKATRAVNWLASRAANVQNRIPGICFNKSWELRQQIFNSQEFEMLNTIAEDPINVALWAWWRYEINPKLSRLPSPTMMQEANRKEMVLRLYTRIVDWKTG